MIRKGLFIALASFLLWGCSQNTGNSNNSDSATNKTTADSTKKTFSGPVIGDRINGPANIRNVPNGRILFTLNDQTLVDCTDQQEGWYQVSVSMQLAPDEPDSVILKKGRKIIANGKVMGEIMEDMQANGMSFQDKDNNTFVQLMGYSYKDNIYPNTIIENAFPAFLAKTNRTKASLQPFITNFQLQDEAESFKPYTTYYNYENSIDDPSPGFRLMLVFDKDQLIAVVHARALSLNDVTTVETDRGYKISYFKDTPKATQDKFTKMYNEFVDSAD
jgi:hypothetical protein